MFACLNKTENTFMNLHLSKKAKISYIHHHEEEALVV